jgi:hypothetical protein
MSHLLDEKADGVFIIAVTPFTDTGPIDEASIDRVVEFYLERGVSGITILGMMGEAHKLTSEESRIVMTRYLRRVDGRVPVVVGVSALGTDPLAGFANEAMDWLFRRSARPARAGACSPTGLPLRHRREHLGRDVAAHLRALSASGDAQA